MADLYVATAVAVGGSLSLATKTEVSESKRDRSNLVLPLAFLLQVPTPVATVAVIGAAVYLLVKSKACQASQGPAAAGPVTGQASHGATGAGLVAARAVNGQVAKAAPLMSPKGFVDDDSHFDDARDGMDDEDNDDDDDDDDDDDEDNKVDETAENKGKGGVSTGSDTKGGSPIKGGSLQDEKVGGSVGGTAAGANQTSSNDQLNLLLARAKAASERIQAVVDQNTKK